MASDLKQDTAVERIKEAPGWYTANLSDAWNWQTPAGGTLMTVAMRAMVAELNDPSYKPISATTLFCSPVPSGPMEIRVEVLRRGNAAAQLRAALSSTRIPGPGLEVSATFARDRQGFDMIGAEPPNVPPPEQCPMFDEHGPHRLGRFPFLSNVEVRLAQGFPYWATDFLSKNPSVSRAENEPARFARWYKYHVPQLTEQGIIDPLAIPPIADTMPSAIANKLGPEGPPFHAPSLDLTIHFMEDARTDYLLVAAYARRARSGYATAEAEIWTSDGKLTAYATQTMILRTRK
ncbi:MAG: thioesterase family protein [Polyangiaceae bacterium]|nr:thioesterase family protein [Polyangiaceae bacterium]